MKVYTQKISEATEEQNRADILAFMKDPNYAVSETQICRKLGIKSPKTYSKQGMWESRKAAIRDQQAIHDLLNKMGNERLICRVNRGDSRGSPKWRMMGPLDHQQSQANTNHSAMVREFYHVFGLDNYRKDHVVLMEEDLPKVFKKLAAWGIDFDIAATQLDIKREEVAYWHNFKRDDGYPRPIVSEVEQRYIDMTDSLDRLDEDNKTETRRLIAKKVLEEAVIGPRHTTSDQTDED